ncbi:hypothetical protein IEQ34_023477 [Dendrobium chrysotoxum]|uniref:Uncharacterized protein n=1 Tax=Dendrobium chrysotoxum TaxID=161865 RepID=A0AAV7FQL1_DENCH|nr:hypothetical protein IEQ34_025992 [Dendrobium chrysotoxum]KAH0440291.1 hypothetical protein IEQ34_025660 [Dendrobium chrysotoxum]KAH0440372.1 hypothetical protein IEQ34_025614 [Dendrobium chrysotoxum]KAH0446012.1 hypothetical protein IEQ34_025152 [Dendrobium chrysotoxum]KAH0446058.1 hypothetical protein IEQ34_025104 [Dendrobium chrysotoxum]
MLVREVGELLRSIEIPHLYPNENRSESLPASACSLCSRHTHAPARMPPWFGTKPSDTYDRRRKRPPCTAGGSTCSFSATSKEERARLRSKERKRTSNGESRSASVFFQGNASGLERWNKDGFRSLCASRMR